MPFSKGGAVTPEGGGQKNLEMPEGQELRKASEKRLAAGVELERTNDTVVPPALKPTLRTYRARNWNSEPCESMREINPEHAAERCLRRLILR